MGGRKTIYRPEMIEQVKAYKSQCLKEKKPFTCAGLAKQLGVSERLISSWKHHKPDFRDAVGKFELVRGWNISNKIKRKHDAMIERYRECGIIEIVAAEFQYDERHILRMFKSNGFDHRKYTRESNYHKPIECSHERISMTVEESFCRERWNQVLSQAW